MRAPFWRNPDYEDDGWETPEPWPLAETAAPCVFIEDDIEEECLVDQRGEPLFTEAPPFGFCSQQEGESHD